MTPRKQITAPAPAATSPDPASIVAVVTPEVVEGNGPTSTVGILIVDDDTRLSIAHDTARSISESMYFGVKASQARTDMFDSVLKFRRTFPASEGVRAVLGADAADLIGQTPEYASAVAGVYEEAKRNLVSKFRREVGTEKAKVWAEREIKNLKQNIGNDIRAEIEHTARGQKDPVLFMLGHGFQPRKGAPKSAVLQEGVKLELLTGEDGAVTGAKVVLPKAGKIAQPVEDSSKTPAGDTAENLLKGLAEKLAEPATNPISNVNVGTGALRSILAMTTSGKVNGLTQSARDLAPAARQALAKQIAQVAFETITALGESLDEAERFEVAKDAESALSAIVFRLNGGQSTRKGAPMAEKVAITS